MVDLNKKPNRLINEKSPYLLQHAYNPVDWFPWCDEAFNKAKTENKPVFLSIGYSTCHWCHVMERESFEDGIIAEKLNKSYISIKVDREEKPDVDSIYMNVCQMVTGSGGWPLSVFMSHDKKPFFAGTYFPKDSLLHLLANIEKNYHNNIKLIQKSQQEIITALNKPSSKGDLDPNVIEAAYKQLEAGYDKKYGGFGVAPKFPTPHNILFLIKYYQNKGDNLALEMAENTLVSMYKGGIYDHIGFGFARYSTDKYWLAPHFEKMLYDNAILIYTFSEIYEATNNELYKQITDDIITFIQREMTHPEGGFYSAIDADSEGIEGKFYLWAVDEIKEVLGERAAEFCNAYDITEKGNFEGKNIPNLIKSSISQDFRQDIEKLYKFRKNRIPPFKDDKILTGWNGLMITAFAKASAATNNTEYLETAEKAAAFIFNNMINDDNGLFLRYRDGSAANPAVLDDYAYLIWGLTELYKTSGKNEYLDKAVVLTEKTITDFWDFNDNGNSGFFLNGKNEEHQIYRPKEIYDGALPSGNAVMAGNLVTLAQYQQNISYLSKANEIINTFALQISEYPMAHCFSMINLLALSGRMCIGGICEVPFGETKKIKD